MMFRWSKTNRECGRRPSQVTVRRHIDFLSEVRHRNRSRNEHGENVNALKSSRARITALAPQCLRGQSGISCRSIQDRFCYVDGFNNYNKFYSVGVKINFHQTTSGSPRTGDFDFSTFSTNGVARVKSITAHDYAGAYHKDFTRTSNFGSGGYDNWRYWTRYYRRGPGTLVWCSTWT